MNTLALKRRSAATAAVILIFALSAPALAVGGEDIDETLEMSPEGTVQVENLAGSIEFSGWDRDEIQIRGEAGDDVEEVEIDSSSQGVQIRVRNARNQRSVDGTDLYLRIPKTANIEAEGVSADISVSGISGKSIILNTVSGDLDIDAEPTRIELSSVSGEIELEGDIGRSSVESVSGDITMNGPSGEVSVSTVSGDLTLDAGKVSRGRFESVSGEVSLSLALEDGGRLTCDSMSGDVSLRLPASQEAEFSAQSYSGDIRTDFGKSIRTSKGPGTMLEHRAGDSGAQIRLETFSGDISISSE